MADFAEGHALLIQITAYQHLAVLPAVDDAEALAAVLVDPSGGGYSAENVVVLTDASATRSAVLTRLAELADRTSSEATAIVYFSGHGGTIDSAAGTGEYLLPVDTAADGGGTIRPETAISGAELTRAIRALPADRIVLILDCCHAGGIGQPRSVSEVVGSRGFQPGFADRFQEVLASGRGRVLLCSSRADELSWVEAGASHGLFTEHLVRGLRGAAADETGFVRVFDLFEYLQPRVTATRSTQHPVFKGDLETNFAVTQGGHVPRAVTEDDPDHRYDAYISFAQEDEGWVRTQLLPRLDAAHLSVAISRDVEALGVARVVSIERGLQQAKRTVVVLSEAYLADTMSEFENTLAQTMAIEEGRYRILPVRISALTASQVPARLRMLGTLDLHASRDPEGDYQRLVRTLEEQVTAM